MILLRYGGKSSVFTQKSRFPTLGKSKPLENCVSQTWESQKHSKTTFPNFGKVKNTQKSRFPTLGKSKTLKNRVSQPWESQNHSKTALPNFGKIKITRFLRFRLPSKATSPAHSMKTECLSFRYGFGTGV